MGANVQVVRAVLLAVLGGGLSVVQTGVNTRLSGAFSSGDGRVHEYGAFFSAACNFLSGLITISVIANVQKPGVSHMDFQGMRWYNYAAGPLGATYVTSAIFFSKKLGVALYFVVLMAGTLTVSLVIDRRGFLTLPSRPVTKRHVLALCILLAGAVMVQEPNRMGGASGSGEATAELKILYSIAVFFCGFANPVQAAVNRSTAGFVGTPFWATWMSFGGGFIIISVVALVISAVAGPAQIADAEWWNFLGGVCGVVFVVSAVVATPVLGACYYYCIMISSQLTAAFIFDSIPLLDYKKKDVTALRVIGTVVSVAAIILYSLPVKSATDDPEARGDSSSTQGVSFTGLAPAPRDSPQPRGVYQSLVEDAAPPLPPAVRSPPVLNAMLSTKAVRCGDGFDALTVAGYHAL
eukprot:TRINITY_DN9956_c0_g1_i1.p1 TRINITY_DN9956_c0_g1~~TRINITY_DN9956_c0_g1_i1.p1  ORF type:complete len:408 (+),score=57.38 TRINITY_DN9956_c0_g1_i1:154-1377(+)